MNNLAERVEFLRGPGGVAAALYWLGKVLLRQEVHGVLASQLRLTEHEAPAGFQFIELNTLGDIASMSQSLLDQLDAQSGAGVRSLIRNGSRVYALVTESQVACQLNISPRQVVVDSPVPLRIVMGPKDAFLGYLHTHTSFRRQGLAKNFLLLACDSLKRAGFERCVCHVRMTNVPSLAAFRRAQWQRVGWIVTTRGGRFVAAPGCARSGIRIEPIN